MVTVKILVYNEFRKLVTKTIDSSEIESEYKKMQKVNIWNCKHCNKKLNFVDYPLCSFCKGLNK